MRLRKKARISVAASALEDIRGPEHCLQRDCAKHPALWFDMIMQQNDLVCITIFRGAKCKNDCQYLKQLGVFQTAFMSKEGVCLIALSSDGLRAAHELNTSLGLTSTLGYSDVIGDEQCTLVKWLQEEMEFPSNLAVCESGISHPALVFFAHHGVPVFQWECNGCDRYPTPAGKRNFFENSAV